MDKEEDDVAPAEEWKSSLNATCNRISTQYLNLLRASAGISSSNPSLSNNGRMGSSHKIGGSLDMDDTYGYDDEIIGIRNKLQQQHEDLRGGGGLMKEMNEPPPPLAADASLSSLQAKLAAQNLCVAASNLLDLIRTLRLSALLMEQRTIALEEEEEYRRVKKKARIAILESTKLEAEIMKIRNSEL